MHSESPALHGFGSSKFAGTAFVGNWSTCILFQEESPVQPFPRMPFPWFVGFVTDRVSGAPQVFQDDRTNSEYFRREGTRAGVGILGLTETIRTVWKSRTSLKRSVPTKRRGQ